MIAWLGDRPALVTGAGGFLGAAVVRRLVALGARVRAWLGPEAAAGLARPPAGVAIGHGDIADRAALDRMLDGVACVYHLAGPPSAAASFAAPAEHLRVHAHGTAALLERCVARGVPRLVYVSSAEVYAAAPQLGPELGQIGEDHPRAPRSPYGIAKLAAEQILEACAPPQLTATIVRPFSVYGPGGSPASLIGTLIAAARRGEAPALADLRPVRDYVFVDDVADGIVRAGGRDGGVRAYNLATGRGISVRDVLRAAGRADLELRPRAADRPAAALTLALTGDPARARAELGFTAGTALHDGLRRTLATEARA